MAKRMVEQPSEWPALLADIPTPCCACMVALRVGDLYFSVGRWGGFGAFIHAACRRGAA